MSAAASRRRILAAGLILLGAALSLAGTGCGQKSALYLPQKKKLKVPGDATNPEGSAPEAPGPGSSPGAAPDAVPDVVPDAPQPPPPA